MLFTTFFSVVILSPAAAILVIAGNTPSLNAAGILWFVVAGILASLLFDSDVTVTHENDCERRRRRLEHERLR
jgi:hypothetical protein